MKESFLLVVVCTFILNFQQNLLAGDKLDKRLGCLKEWAVKGASKKSESSMEKDPLTNSSVMVFKGKHILETGTEVKYPCVINAKLRFPNNNVILRRLRGKSNIVFRIGTRQYFGKTLSAYKIIVTAFKHGVWGAAAIDSDISRNELKSLANQLKKTPRVILAELKKNAWGRRFSITPRFSEKDISPVMPENMRVSLEKAVAGIPDYTTKYLNIKIRIDRRLIRIYVNGAFMFEGENIFNSPAKITAEISGTVMVSHLSVRGCESFSDRFVSVPLDLRCNRKSNVDLMKIPRMLKNIPFVLPHNSSGMNQIDIGQSLYRHRLGTKYTRDYDPRVTVPPPNSIDPERITLAIPERTYSRAWLLAYSERDKNHVPDMTLRFYRPKTNWSIDSAAKIPYYDAASNKNGVKSFIVKTSSGKEKKLWLIPVKLDSAAMASDFPTQALELTKKVYPNVAYPDPCNYAYFQGGLPSGVQLFGLTLECAPICARSTGNNNGNTYTLPQKPVWNVSLRNQLNATQNIAVKLRVTSPYGNLKKYTKHVVLKPLESKLIEFNPPIKELGRYRVETTVSSGEWSQSGQSAFLILPDFQRKATPENSTWGLWCWLGGHETNPDIEDNARLMKAFGAINSFPLTGGTRRHPVNTFPVREKFRLAPQNFRIIPRRVPRWAYKNPPDKKDFDDYIEKIGETIQKIKKENPDLVSVNAFAENSLSIRMTHGVPPWVYGEKWFPEYTKKEKSKLNSLWNAAKAGVTGAKKYEPNVKFYLGHCSPDFFKPFFMLDDWKEYQNKFDGFGLDMPQFERMPERQPRATEPSLLYFLSKEMKERGMADKELIHFESYFPPSLPLGLGWRKQADSVVRTAVLSLALGTTKFERSWSLFDSGDRWGSQHYGCAGLISRAPEFIPKPAATAYATMTRLLDTAKYDKWLDVGSKSAFCVGFKDAEKRIYAVWTIHGQRELTFAIPKGAKVSRVDEQGNSFALKTKNDNASVMLAPTPQWIIVEDGEINSPAVGPPKYSSHPGKLKLVLENFEKHLWKYHPESYARFEQNNWDVRRTPGKMVSKVRFSKPRNSKVFEVSLEKPDLKKPLVGFYGVYTPPEDILIPGKAEALGFYGYGKSAWNRIVFVLEDSKNEQWISCGPKDAWNSDDIYSRSYFNHDGWRYMEIQLPSNLPGDNFREKGTVSWGGDKDGIVDLPLKLKKIIIVSRPSMIYANKLLPVDSTLIKIDDIQAIYNSKDNMTDLPVKTQIAAADMFKNKKIDPSTLPNRIRELTEKGIGKPPVIEKIYPPEVMQAGDSIYVKISPIEGALKYKVYVSAYQNGACAKAMGRPQKGKPNVIFIRHLQPAVPMYLFATYIGKGKKESKPSAPRKTVLKDEFPFK